MRLIDVLVKQANKEIKDGAILKITDEELFGKESVFEFEFEFNEDHFYGEEGMTVEKLYSFDTDFLNSEVELISPKEKKYLVKFNMRGMKENISYLNFHTRLDFVSIQNGSNTESYQTHFTKKELQSIEPVREFLGDMPDKYELIEVEENAND